MNFIKKMTVYGLSAIALSSVSVDANEMNENLVSHLTSEPDFIDKVLMQLSSMGKQFCIKQDEVEQFGFEPGTFTIHLPKNIANMPKYCGYNETDGKIVPIELPSVHVLFDALAEALNYATKRTNDGIFEHLYGQDNAKVFKQLWENPYSSPESKITALTGFIYDAGTNTLNIDKISTMMFDAEDFIKFKDANANFYPRVFSVTYDRFLQIQAQHKHIDFLKDIEKLLTYKKMLG